MKKVITIAAVAATGIAGYLIGGRNGEAKGRREAQPLTKKAYKAAEKAREKAIDRQQRPSKAVGANQLAARHVLAKSRRNAR